MEIQTLALRVIEDYLPLVELRAIVVELIVPIGKRPDVVSISARIVSQERDGVRALRGKIVDRADETFALAIFPRGIPGFPIGHMWSVCLERDFSGGCSVEIGVREQRFRSVRTHFEEILAGPRELQIVLPYIMEPPAAPEVGSALVRRCDADRALKPVE